MVIRLRIAIALLLVHAVILVVWNVLTLWLVPDTKVNSQALVRVVLVAYFVWGLSVRSNLAWWLILPFCLFYGLGGLFSVGYQVYVCQSRGIRCDFLYVVVFCLQALPLAGCAFLLLQQPVRALFHRQRRES